MSSEQITRLPGPQSRPADGVEVGDFRQGTPGSRWALSRYLVGRAIGEYVGRVLLVTALAVLGLAVLAYLAAPTWIAVLIGLVALAVLAFRALLQAALRRISAAAYFGPLEERLRRLASDTRGDVRRELRRLGLPSHAWTMPLLAVRLAGRRRARTVAQLRRFDADRVVPRSRVDDLHLVLRAAAQRHGDAGPSGR